MLYSTPPCYNACNNIREVEMKFSFSNLYFHFLSDSFSQCFCQILIVSVFLTLQILQIISYYRETARRCMGLFHSFCSSILFHIPWIRPRSLFFPIFKGLLFAWTLWIRTTNLKFVALTVPEIIGGTQKIWAVPGYAHAPFSPKFFMGLSLCVRMNPVNVSAKVAVRSFSRSCDSSDCSFGMGLRIPNLGEGEAVRGRGWYRSKELLWLPIGSP